MTTPSSLHPLARRYFDHLAQAFPVICASDEFHFMPRAEAAVDQYHRLDSLDRSALAATADSLKSYRSQFQRCGSAAEDLETQIDAVLMVGSVNGLLAELEQTRSWRHNPLFYLKVAFIGVDHAWNKPAASEAERRDRTLSRLDRLPGLLSSGMANLPGTSTIYRMAALAMTGDCRSYLIRWLQGLAETDRRLLEKPVQTVIRQLMTWKRYVEQ